MIMDGNERRGTARRMRRMCQIHRHNGKPHRTGQSERAETDKSGHNTTDQRRKDMSTEHIARLC